MKTAYPIIITQDEKYLLVYVPDLDIYTQGEDIANAIEMARDAIGLWGICEEDAGREIPKPTSMPKAKDGEIVTLVDIDFVQYRKMQDNRAVRKNCTIPSWLNEAAEKEQINFSAVLQQALKEQLGIVGA